MTKEEKAVYDIGYKTGMLHGERKGMAHGLLIGCVAIVIVLIIMAL